MKKTLLIILLTAVVIIVFGIFQNNTVSVSPDTYPVREDFNFDQ